MVKKIIGMIALVTFFSLCGCEVEDDEIPWVGNIINEAKDNQNETKNTVNEVTANDMSEYALVIENIRSDKHSSKSSTLKIVMDESESSCMVTGDDKDKVDVVVDDEKKMIKISAEHGQEIKPVDIVVNAKVTKLSATDCELTFKAEISDVEQVVVELSGDYDGNVSINAEKCSVKFEGNGNLSFSGETTNLDVDAKGAMLFEAQKLKSKHANVYVNGTASCSVYASESVSAVLEGIGEITYYGKPANVDKKINGLGIITEG